MLSIFCLFFLLILNNAFTVEWDCNPTTNSNTNNNPYTLSSSCAISNNNFVMVTATLEIIGTNIDMNSLVTITAANDKRHFKIEGGTLTLRYLHLTGGDMTGTPNGGGGSISVLKSTSGNLALGTLNLYSTMFTNNIARRGSVIYSQYTGGTTNTKNSVNIFNSRFKNNGNHADCNTGGVISLWQSSLTIENSTITNNGPVKMRGGAIFVRDLNTVSNGPVITLINVNFTDNLSKQHGGVVWSNVNNNNNAITFDIKKCYFKNNKATGTTDDGGGVFAVNGNTLLTVRESSFIGNEAANNNGHVLLSVQSTFSGVTKSPTVTFVNS